MCNTQHSSWIRKGVYSEQHCCRYPPSRRLLYKYFLPYLLIECEVKAKIKSIRAQYTREKQKSSKVKTGTGTDEVYVSKWPHLEQLKFLDDFIIAKKSISNLSVVSKVLCKSIPVDQANDIYIHIIYVLCISIMVTYMQYRYTEVKSCPIAKVQIPH